MEATRTTLDKHSERFPDFLYYGLHVQKIESHIEEHPDIAIEVCKSLIEGISKSILQYLDPTFDEATAIKNKVSVQKLFKRALENVAKLNEDFEEGYVHSTGQIINVTSNIRTQRGDISHGKAVPKIINSTSAFARLAAQMTDLTVSYVLEHFFVLELEGERLDYDSKELEAYNDWLDDSVEDFPIRTAKYSWLLHKYDYPAYEYLYTNDYRIFLDFDEDEKVAPEKVEEPKAAVPEPVGGPEVPPPSSVGKPKEHHPEPTPEPNRRSLIAWSETQETAIQEFAQAEGMDAKAVKEIVQKYLFDEMIPFADSVVAALLVRPSLKERRKTVATATDKLVALAKSLNP